MGNTQDGLQKFYKPVERQRISEKIYDQINQLIMDDVLKPGDQLPSERNLAEMFNVSRNSIRDAIRVLEARGLLEVRQGGGTFIHAARKDIFYANLLDLIAQKKENIGAVLQLRLILEPSMTYHAALNITPEEIQKLELILDAHEAKAALGNPGAEEDSSFHRTIAEVTGNKLLVFIYDLINESLQGTRDVLLQYNGSSTRLGHRRILEALKAGEPEQARLAMIAHINEVLETYSKLVV